VTDIAPHIIIIIIIIIIFSQQALTFMRHLQLSCQLPAANSFQ
jgi:hypothetical protein